MRQVRGILSLSGGLDSSTLLAKFKDNIEKCVFFDYGSKQNAREYQAVCDIAAYYNKEVLKIDSSGLFSSFKSALLAHSKELIQEGPYSEIEVSNAKVPFRNGIFVATLVGLAESFNLNTVYLAAHAGDHRLYADCTPEFFEAYKLLVNIYSAGSISVEAPFINIDKSEIAKIAISLNLPVSLTYSCYNGGLVHCGKCPTCIERRESLALFDSTEYLN